LLWEQTPANFQTMRLKAAGNLDTLYVVLSIFYLMTTQKSLVLRRGNQIVLCPTLGNIETKIYDYNS